MQGFGVRAAMARLHSFVHYGRGRFERRSITAEGAPFIHSFISISISTLLLFLRYYFILPSSAIRSVAGAVPGRAAAAERWRSEGATAQGGPLDGAVPGCQECQRHPRPLLDLRSSASGAQDCVIGNEDCIYPIEFNGKPFVIVAALSAESGGRLVRLRVRTAAVSPIRSLRLHSGSQWERSSGRTFSRGKRVCECIAIFWACLSLRMYVCTVLFNYSHARLLSIYMYS